jgi:hypothetical protein
MAYVDFVPIKENFTKWWNGEYTGRCLAYITAPKKNAAPVQEPEKYDDLVKYWSDAETVLKRHKAEFDNTYYLAEGYPIVRLNLGAAGHAGYFANTRYKFAWQTAVWFQPIPWEEKIVFSKDSFLYKKTIELAQYYCAESKGDYLVSMPDIAGNIDALGHLRGQQNVMLKMFDDPDIVKNELQLIQKAWETMIPEIYAVIRDNNYGGGVIYWLGTWGPGLHSQLQADMSVMLSPELYSEFIMDELRKQAAFLDYPLYHLDGVEQKRHLDNLLSIDKLKVIQWTCVEGQPSPLEELDALKRIQKAGKNIVMIAEPKYVQPLLENLSAKGLYLKIEAENPRQADELFAIIKKYSAVR